MLGLENIDTLLDLITSVSFKRGYVLIYLIVVPSTSGLYAKSGGVDRGCEVRFETAATELKANKR